MCWAQAGPTPAPGTLGREEHTASLWSWAYFSHNHSSAQRGTLVSPKLESMDLPLKEWPRANSQTNLSPSFIIYKRLQTWKALFICLVVTKGSITGSLNYYYYSCLNFTPIFNKQISNYTFWKCHVSSAQSMTQECSRSSAQEIRRKTPGLAPNSARHCLTLRSHHSFGLPSPCPQNQVTELCQGFLSFCLETGKSGEMLIQWRFKGRDTHISGESHSVY